MADQEGLHARLEQQQERMPAIQLRAVLADQLVVDHGSYQNCRFGAFRLRDERFATSPARAEAGVDQVDEFHEAELGGTSGFDLALAALVENALRSSLTGDAS